METETGRPASSGRKIFVYIRYTLVVKTISVGQLRQNPTAALDALERGEEFEITRHRKVIGRLVPANPIRFVTWGRMQDVIRATPLRDDSWWGEIESDRALEDVEPDVFEREEARRRRQTEREQQP